MWQHLLAGEPTVRVRRTYSSQEIRNKTPQNPPAQLRDVTPVRLLLYLGADRASLQCSKPNTTLKGNICLQLQC